MSLRRYLPSSAQRLAKAGRRWGVEVRKFARPAARDRHVYVGVASVPQRVESLRTVVKALLPQVDRVGVYLNGYAEVPAFLKHPRVDVARSQDHGDVRDNGKFYFLGRTTHRFYATVDDDINYPADYIYRLRQVHKQALPSAAIGVHGAVYPSPVIRLTGPRYLLHFSAATPYVLPVHLLGTGTVLFDQSLWELRYEEFGTPGMADVWFARAAVERQAPLLVVNRDRHWLTPASADDLHESDDSLYSEARHDDSRQASLLNEGGVSAGGLQRLVDYLTVSDPLAEALSLAQVIALDEIRRTLGLPPLAASEARQLSERIARVRSPWGSAPGKARWGSHAEAIAGLLAEDLPGPVVQSLLELLERSAGLARTDSDRWRELPYALRFDSKPARRDRIESTVLAEAMQRSGEDVRALWPLSDPSPSLALAAERAGLTTDFENLPGLEGLAQRNPLHAARLLHEFLEVRNWSVIPDVAAWRRAFERFFEGKEMQALLTVALSRAGQDELAAHAAVGMWHRWPTDVEARLADAVVRTAAGGVSERFGAGIAVLDSLLGEVSLDGYRRYMKAEEVAVKHWIHLLDGSPGAPPPMSAPSVSVIMTVHNNADTVREAVEGVLRAEGVSVEVLVVDDASSDGTADVVAGIDDERIRLIVNETNVGPYVSRNRGLAEAAGTYLAFADADDWSHPQRLRYQIDRLQQDERLVGCTVAHVRFRADGQADLENHLQFIGHGPVTLLMQRRVVDEIGGFDYVRTRGDIEFLGRLRAHFGGDALGAFGAPLVLATSSRSSNSKRFSPATLQLYRNSARRWHREAAERGSRLFVAVDGVDRAPFVAPPGLVVPRSDLELLGAAEG